MSEQGEPRLHTNRWGDAVIFEGGGSVQDPCTCFNLSRIRPQRRIRFHPDLQDTSAPGWLRLLDLIEEAAADGREVFKPLVGMPAEQRRQIVTLPPTIAKLTAVKQFVLYRSNLVRIPAEIGAMASLEEFTPYTSYRLHWFPYELARCPNLVRSTVSTRAVYGNFKLRPPFPPLPHEPVATDGIVFDDLDPGVWGDTAIRACSVCGGLFGPDGVCQVWISLKVATDVLPLLVNACSVACIQALPQPPEHYVQVTHSGGPHIDQPPADYL